jgi:hypothetical protein
LLLSVGAAACALLAIELALRALVVPSTGSAGRVLGSDLPPLRLIPARPPTRRARVRRPGRLRRDDLAGVMREDRLLGYAPREHAVSTNGWWQSNGLGARARHDTAAEPAPGVTRVLVFGDSFASGSRVAQDDAWPAVLEATEPRLEVVSLGVDGYAVGQSLLRYRTLRDRVQHHVVLLTVSPRADFWRDVNTLRALAGWRSWTVMPRFVLDEGALRLVPGPYSPPSAIYADNRDGPSARLRDHLARYDRFYVPWMYEEPAGWSARSTLWRFVLARWHAVVQRRAHARALAPDGEAVAVTTRIAETMCRESAARGTRFLLLLLPSERDLGHLRRGTDRAWWEEIGAAFAAAGVPTVDLAPVLLAAAPGEIDRGHDGTHYGPRANRLIAGAVGRALANLGDRPEAACEAPPAAR